MTRTIPCIAILAWIVVVATGVLWIYSGVPQPPGSVVTARIDLPRNHQIAGADIGVPWEVWGIPGESSKKPFTGRHLLSAKVHGAAIRESDVSVQPVFPVAGDRDMFLAYSLTASDKSLVDFVSIGTQLLLCTGKPDPQKTASASWNCAREMPVAVEGVHRAGDATGSSWLLLKVPQGSAKEMGEYMTSTSRYLAVLPR